MSSRKTKYRWNMGNLYKNTERNRNVWMSRLQDGCGLVGPENGTGLYCLSNSFSLLHPPPSLLLFVIFIQSFLPSILPLSFTFSYLWCTNGPRWLPCPQLSMSIGTYKWPGIYLSIYYSNCWDKKTLVDPDHPFEPGPTDHESGQPMTHSPWVRCLPWLSQLWPPKLGWMPIYLGKWKEALLKKCLQNGG